jgi:hypothetical protein
MAAFLDKAPCSIVEVGQSFRGAYSLLHHHHHCSDDGGSGYVKTKRKMELAV